MDADLEKIIASAQQARLIPTVSDSKKEERATSCLLSTFTIVPEFARQVLSDAGAPVGKRLKIECYTEVIFKTSESGKNSRPDGLIIVTLAGRKWMALIESKIGNSQLSTEQVEEYIDLAKKHNINAVITISNQYATIPTHHPVKINKNKIRSVNLYHFSWLSLVSKAILIADNKSVEDHEQSYILNELVRYLDHDSSGVTSLAKMHSDWKEACTQIQQGVALAKTNDIVKNSASSWHQLQRYLALKLSISIGTHVTIHLSRPRQNDPELNLQEDCSALSLKNSLDTDFIITNAASKLHFCADFLRRTINISMKLEAPKDKTRATASINWVTRQLKGIDVQNVTIRGYWPKRIAMTSATLESVIENPNVLLPPGDHVLPTYIEVARVVDLMARFKGAKTFVEESSNQFILFYKDVGQHLNKWVPKAPKVKQIEPDLVIEEKLIMSDQSIKAIVPESDISDR